MTRKFLLYFALVCVCHNSYCQQTDTSKYYVVDQTKELALITAANVGKYVNAELGIGINQFGRIGPHPSGVCFYAGSEFKLAEKLLMGPKIGVHFLGGLAFGFSFIYYTDFDASSIVFRPDIGIGLQRFKMAYGYNLKLSNKNFDQINSHLFTAIYLIRLKHLGIIRR